MVNQDKQSASFSSILALSQGIYFLLNGLWPVIHIQSFMDITGPKEDIWLTKTVGLLTVAIGAGLLSAGLLKKVFFSVILIAVGSASGFVFIDVFYVARGVILPVYLWDAAIEFLFLALWAKFFLTKK